MLKNKSLENTVHSNWPSIKEHKRKNSPNLYSLCLYLPRKAFAANFASSELHVFMVIILFLGIQRSYMLANEFIAARPSDD